MRKIERISIGPADRQRSEQLVWDRDTPKVEAHIDRSGWSEISRTRTISSAKSRSVARLVRYTRRERVYVRQSRAVARLRRRLLEAVTAVSVFAR
jgi:hypothetical protein